MNFWWLFVITCLMSWLLTGIFRRYALINRLIDVPNERSSHFLPTPRGGGVAIFLVFLAALPLLIWLDYLSVQSAVGFGGAGALVTMVGFVDDHAHISVRWRLLVHFGAAIWGLYWLDCFSSIDFFGFYLNLGWLGHILAAVYLVWLLNLYNFMDGIDGIASIEAITVCFGSIVMYWLTAPAETTWAGNLLLLAAVSGFLPWNYPHAKIFLGDAGSGFLGIMLGLLSLQAAWTAPKLFWGWIILLGAFIVDATVTLARRLVRRENIFKAHRHHAYQHASRIYGNHVKVSMAFGLINLCWLLPIAGCMVVGWVNSVSATIIAYTPLVWLAIRFKAGVRDDCLDN